MDTTTSAYDAPVSYKSNGKKDTSMKQHTLTACIYLYYDEDDHIINALSYHDGLLCESICGLKTHVRAV